ncbi:DUF4339 domain-containing protein [Actomonas aquatica]|uniref:DUF4339 domain-containing protein n=1 Tax=Actomonas aquatica TaxID=2866162 RepID=A0ABZ1CCY5_9BACT|nr:DUF4339 domain-containing protein [Opitutus sp. WL0086]WRQ89123.1 DUF4339 domain-containing protein [Opitutus sp. WL0086]
MAPQEFYIRNASDTEARGPFNLEQLSSLAENGQVAADTVYYDAAGEKWVRVGSNAELMTALFPEKKKLKVRPKDQVQSLNTSTESVPPIEVTDMLAAAEGRSADTKDKADPREALARAARIGMYACTAILLISGLALLAPSIDTIVAGNYPKLLTQPFAVLGAVDLLLFLLMMLQAVAIYPIIRFRAALGAGFLGLFFYVQGEPQTALYAVLGCVGIYFSTIFTNLFAVILTALIGIGGMGAFAWTVLNT